MDQKQKNDSTTDKPFVHDAAGRALAGLLFLPFLSVLWLVLGDAMATVRHAPFILSICAVAVTVFCAAVGVCLSPLVLRGISVDRKRKREQKRNNAEAQPPDIPTAISRECAAAVGLFWFITALLGWVYLVCGPYLNDPLLDRFLVLTELCVFVELPLLILWGIFAGRKYRREQNRKSAQPREPVPRGEAVPAGEADRENEIYQ